MALIETTRCADACLDLCQSARGDLRFQRLIHCFRVFRGAGSFRVVLSPAIVADKEIAFALQRRESRTRRAGGQRAKCLKVRGKNAKLRPRRDLITRTAVCLRQLSRLRCNSLVGSVDSGAPVRSACRFIYVSGPTVSCVSTGSRQFYLPE